MLLAAPSLRVLAPRGQALALLLFPLRCRRRPGAELGVNAGVGEAAAGRIKPILRHGAAALVGAGTHCCSARGHQGPSSSAAPFRLAHVHPASTFLLPEANFLSIPINPSADVSRTALKVGLQKSSNSETCRGAAKAPQSPALITANGQKELYDDLSHCHLQNDLAATLPLVPLLACHPSLTSVPLLERRAQRRDRCVQCTPWVFSWQKQVLPFFSLLNMHPAAGA